MSATNAPFGFRPAFHPSGFDRATKYTVASGYGTAMYKGQPCILNTNGTVTVGTAAADLLGIIAGFEYIDATGKPWVSTTWPAAQTVLSGTTPVAWVWDDPAITYEVQADGSLAQTAIGDQADVSNVGNATSIPGGNPVSTCTLSATLAGAGSQGQFRIVGFGQQVDNVPADAFTIAQVKLARSQFVSNKVAI
jgi:hypothetical protein